MNSKILSKIAPWLTRIEIVISVIFIFSLILRNLYVPGSLYIVLSSLIGLFILYFISVYMPIPQKASHIYSVIFSKLIRIASAFTVLGIFFMYMKLKGYSEILLIGITSITIGCTFFMVFALQNFNTIRPFRFDLVRGLILLLLAITLLIEKHTL